MRATYSVEDNKLRLYADGKLDPEDLKAVYAAEFSWAPKQDLFVKPSWTPGAEDLLLEFVDEIEDEDYSPTERAADRAERFSGYRDKRTGEAFEHAADFGSGPTAFGHQNRDRAERQARRHDRHRTHAVSQWSKAEYWQERTSGVISHALYKSSAAVRRERILRLESEQRKHAAHVQEVVTNWTLWGKIALLPDEPATKAAISFSGGSCWSIDYQHPRCEKKASLWSLLTMPEDPITGLEAARMYLAASHPEGPNHPGSRNERWTAHYVNRLAYEMAMLKEEGGWVAESEIEPGGWIRTNSRTGSCLHHVDDGWKQVQRVNRSPVTKRVTSVQVLGTWKGFTEESGYTKSGTRPALISINVERLGADAYRPPTEDELKDFQDKQKIAKKAAAATKPKEPSLLNPTMESAQRLQDLWNAQAKAKHDERVRKRQTYGEFEPQGVVTMTQAQYSGASKGSYSHYETRTIYEDGRASRRSSNMWTSEDAKYDASLGQPVCKLRIRYPLRVVVITDKPQKEIPVDWEKNQIANGVANEVLQD